MLGLRWGCSAAGAWTAASIPPLAVSGNLGLTRRSWPSKCKERTYSSFPVNSGVGSLPLWSTACQGRGRGFESLRPPVEAADEIGFSAPKPLPLAVGPVDHSGSSSIGGSRPAHAARHLRADRLVQAGGVVRHPCRVARPAQRSRLRRGRCRGGPIRPGEQAVRQRRRRVFARLWAEEARAEPQGRRWNSAGAAAKYQWRDRRARSERTSGVRLVGQPRGRLG